MKSRIAMVFCLIVGGASLLYAHDLFLKLDSYFLHPDTPVRISVLNGTFTSTEAPLVAGRITNISLVSPDGITSLDTTAWSVRGDSSFLALRTGDAGTYVVGVSTRARNLDLEADDFNAYLEEDGITDILSARRRSNELGRAVTERYSKHVKAVFQVGAARSSTFDTPLGYRAVPRRGEARRQPSGDRRGRIPRCAYRRTDGEDGSVWSCLDHPRLSRQVVRQICQHGRGGG